MQHGLSITVHDDIPDADGELIDAGLGAANTAAAPLREVQLLACFARAADGAGHLTTGGVTGAVLGGAIGRTWGACCELQQLWVAPEHRRRGLGGDLVRAFERRATERGCRTFYLETFSFQAPALYAALGYVVKHELHGFAPGIVKYLMVREAAD